MMIYYHGDMETLTESDVQAILQRRDPRYDGRLYFGVRTTGIYCRPICPAQPKPENVVIYKSPAAAEKAGYRPCLRCRPDLAPGNKYVYPGGELAATGLRLIEERCAENIGVTEIAETLGISTRHLRRVFHEYLGTSPIQVIQSRKLHLAKQLLLETDEAVSTIAYAAGFHSLRRFNESFKQCYKTSPSAFRKQRPALPGAEEGITLRLMVRKPYNFNTVLSYLKRHSALGIEEITNQWYRRYIPSKTGYATITITMDQKQSCLVASLIGFAPTQISKVLLRIRNLFDTDHNPHHLPLNVSSPQAGVRVPGAYDPFEIAVSIILGQLISVKQATTTLGALIHRFGRCLDKENGIFAFPAPQVLEKAEVETIGIPQGKASAIRSLSRQVANGLLNFSYSEDLHHIREKLLSIKGVGPWTTEMILMRCFGDADAWPKNDLIIQRAIEQELLEEADWEKNRAYMTHHIWATYAQTLSKW